MKKSDCIFAGIDSLGNFVCLAGYTWECETDATICGNYEPRDDADE